MLNKRQHFVFQYHVIGLIFIPPKLIAGCRQFFFSLKEFYPIYTVLSVLKH